MKRVLLTALVFCAACDNFSAPPPASMPWLHGFTAVAATGALTAEASRRIANVLDTAAEDDYGSLELRADLTGDARTETVLASYRLGVAVVDATGRLIARAPGFDPGGSADDLISLAAGNGQLGSPMIVLAVQTGGHRENAIWVAIYSMTGAGVLQQLFYAPVETHEGSETRTGTLAFTHSGLLYRAPHASLATSWIFDVRRGRYVESAPVDHKPARPDI